MKRSTNSLQHYSVRFTTILALVAFGAFGFPHTTAAFSFRADAAENNQSVSSYDTLQAPVSFAFASSAIKDLAVFGSDDIEDIVIQGDVLVGIAGPDGTTADIDTEPQLTIDDQTLYTVRAEDTLSKIAELFELKAETIRLANNLATGVAAKEGQKLIIPPGDGVMYIVKKGDTLPSISKQFKVDAEDVADFNYLPESPRLITGQKIFIPGGVIAKPATIKNVKRAAKSGAKLNYSGSFIRPVTGSITSPFGVQRKNHVHEGIDFGVHIGTPIYASHAGVIQTRGVSASGGYGNLIILKGTQGIETRYAHLSKFNVSTGAHVNQGDLIGYSGNTGRSTGPHLHFELRQYGKAVNPKNYLP